MTDYEVLQYKIGDDTIQDIGSLTFISWMANKLNNVSVDQRGKEKQILNELTALIVSPVLGKMPLENKIDIFRKMEKLGIQL